MSVSLATFFAQRVPYLQSASTDAAFQSWARQVTIAINGMAPMSTFSAASPNSTVTAAPTTMGLNLAPASVASTLWLKQVGSSNTGWIPVA